MVGIAAECGTVHPSLLPPSIKGCLGTSASEVHVAPTLEEQRVKACGSGHPMERGGAVGCGCRGTQHSRNAGTLICQTRQWSLSLREFGTFLVEQPLMGHGFLHYFCALLSRRFVPVHLSPYWSGSQRLGALPRSPQATLDRLPVWALGGLQPPAQGSRPLPAWPCGASTSHAASPSQAPDRPVRPPCRCLCSSRDALPPPVIPHPLPILRLTQRLLCCRGRPSGKPRLMPLACGRGSAARSHAQCHVMAQALGRELCCCVWAPLHLPLARVCLRGC